MSERAAYYWDDLFRGPYVKIPWTIFEDPAFDDPRVLARYVRALIEADRAKRKRRRYVPRVIWEAVLVAFGHRCAYCARSDLPLQREHRMPVALGGMDVLENIVPACEPCNRQKGADHPDLWPIWERP